jgi:hypothetical protein
MNRIDSRRVNETCSFGGERVAHGVLNLPAALAGAVPTPAMPADLREPVELVPGTLFASVHRTGFAVRLVEEHGPEARVHVRSGVVDAVTLWWLALEASPAPLSVPAGWNRDIAAEALGSECVLLGDDHPLAVHHVALRDHEDRVWAALDGVGVQEADARGLWVDRTFGTDSGRSLNVLFGDDSRARVVAGVTRLAADWSREHGVELSFRWCRGGEHPQDGTSLCRAFRRLSLESTILAAQGAPASRKEQ